MGGEEFKMKKVLGVFLFLLLVPLAIIVADEKYQEKYLQLLKNDDLDHLLPILQEWERTAPNDIELYIAYFNYYLRLGASSQITMGKMEDGRYGIYNREEYEKENTTKAISYLDEALKISNDRLDIYFGKCSVLVKTHEYEELTATIKQFLHRSEINKNKWLWSNSETFESLGWPGEEVVFSGLNDFLNAMFNDFALSEKYIEEIVELEMELYPKNVWGLNHAARYYDLSGDREKAIKTLEKAYKIDPMDYVVLGNLAYLCEEAKDYERALEYYNKLKELNIPEATSYADEGIDRIKK